MRVSYNSSQLMGWALSDFATPIQKYTGSYTTVELQDYKYPLHTGITECFLLNDCSRVASRVTKTTQSVELVYKYPLHTNIAECFLLNNCSRVSSRVTKTTESYSSQRNKSQINRANLSSQRRLSRLWKSIWYEFVHLLMIEIHLFYINSISKSPSYTLKFLHLRMMRSTMLKHDYSNALNIALRQNYQCISLTSVKNMYPIVYGVLHILSRKIGWFTLYAWKSCITVFMWYDYNKLTMSNNRLPSTDGQHLSVFRHFQESIHSIRHWYGCNCQTSHPVDSPLLTGAGNCTISLTTLQPYLLTNISNPPMDEIQYSFSLHAPYEDAINIVHKKNDMIACRMPLCSIASYLNMKQAKAVAKMHGIFVAWKAPIGTILLALVEHRCSSHCYNNVSVFKVQSAKTDLNQKKMLKASLNRSKRLERKKITYRQEKLTPSFKNKKAVYNKKNYKKQQVFPPPPPSDKLMQKIITGFCKDTHPSCFEESGCAVCGRLTTKKELIALKDVQCSLDPLVRSGVTSIERTCETQEHKEVTGPILDTDCSSMCTSCHTLLKKGTCPAMALANGIYMAWQSTCRTY